MRYVVYGAGAIGGFMAARLHQQGRSVVLIARGAHRERMAADGIRVRTATEDFSVRLPVVGHPDELTLSAEDIVILGMKTQDTEAALEQLALCAPADMPIFCAQNAVVNEAMALRRFENVYAMYVYVFAVNVVPGIVDCFTSPTSGIIDVGRFPAGVDETTTRVAADLAAAGFSSVVRPDIMKWKYAKLLGNLGNALSAAYGPMGPLQDLYDAVQAEGEACLRAAGIEAAPKQAALDHRNSLLPLHKVAGAAFPGGSSWQSLARGTGRTEIDFLTGEIVLLGRLHGVPTPLNTMLQTVVSRMAVDRTVPGSLDPASLRSLLG